MKKLTILLIAIGSFLSGCVAYEVPNRDRSAYHGDRDRDGVSDRVDRDRDGDHDEHRYGVQRRVRAERRLGGAGGVGAGIQDQNAR